MKNLLLITSLLLTTNYYCAVDTLMATSTITDVTVFFNGAQITRQAPLKLKKGKHLLFFDQLPQELNPKSIQVKGIDGIKILSVKHQLNHKDQAKKSKEEEQILEEIESLKNNNKEIADRIAVFDIEEGILIDNSKIYQGKEGTSVARIKETADFYRARLNEIRKSTLDLRIKQKQQKKKMEESYKKLNELTAKKRQTHSQLLIAVDYEKEKAQTLRFSYYISSAGWEPLYDFRVSNISQPLNLVYNANVYQSSGESWNGVNITLSSNDPMQSGTRPTMGNLYLEKNQYQSYTSDQSSPGVIKGMVTDENNQDALPFCNVVVSKNGKQILGTSTDFDGMYTLKPVPPGYYDVSFSYVGYVSKKLHNVQVNSDKITALNATMSGGLALQEVQVVAYQKPLFEKDKMSNTHTVRRDEVSRMASRSVADIAKITGNGVYSRDNGTGVRGSRTGASVTIIDGVKVMGSTSIPRSAIEEVSVRSGGVSARYGESSSTAWSDYPSAMGNKAYHPKLNKQHLKAATISLANSFKQGITHLEYVIPIPYTIPSDGEDYLLKIKEENLAVDYIYYAVPKVDRDAFLTARINNWNELNLLSGKTSIYYEGTFTGESYLNADQADDTISVSLGRDKGIFINRINDKTRYEKKSFGKNNRETLGWEIVIRNNKSVPINIVIEDQYPLSSRKSIQVELLESGGAKVDERFAKLSWKLHIAPEIVKKINFSYAVEYPKYTNLVVQ